MVIKERLSRGAKPGFSIEDRLIEEFFPARRDGALLIKDILNNCRSSGFSPDRPFVIINRIRKKLAGGELQLYLIPSGKFVFTDRFHVNAYQPYCFVPKNYRVEYLLNENFPFPLQEMFRRAMIVAVVNKTTAMPLISDTNLELLAKLTEAFKVNKILPQDEFLPFPWKGIWFDGLKFSKTGLTVIQTRVSRLRQQVENLGIPAININTITNEGYRLIVNNNEIPDFICPSSQQILKPKTRFN